MFNYVSDTVMFRTMDATFSNTDCISVMLWLSVLCEQLSGVSAVLTHGHAWKLPGSPTSKGAHAILCILCAACFPKCFITDFVGSTNIIYMFDFIDNLHLYSREWLCLLVLQCTTLPHGL